MRQTCLIQLMLEAAKTIRYEDDAQPDHTLPLLLL